MPSETLATEMHTRKRQFQPSIHSYFGNRDALAPSSGSARASSPMSPLLPEEVQSLLLGVGMRVRKSVPEGYKTHKTLGFGMLQEDEEGDDAFTSSAAIKRTLHRITPGKGGANVTTKELMPFCGLHKIGGIDVPSSSAPASISFAREAIEEDMPALSFSQSTLSSSSSQLSFCSDEAAFTANSRKRAYEDEVEEDLDAYFNALDDEDGVVPDISHRRIAALKGFGQKDKAVTQSSVRIAGLDGNDFEDAGFLAPLGQEMDVDDEGI